MRDPWIQKMEQFIFEVICRMFDNGPVLHSDVQTIVKGIEKSLNVLCLSLPQNEKVVICGEIILTWKDYLVAMQLYWNHVHVILMQGKVWMEITKDFYCIPLEVLDVNRSGVVWNKHEVVRHWPTVAEKISEFCKFHLPQKNVPLCIQQLILSFGNVVMFFV